MSTDLQPVYASSVEIGPNAFGYGIYFDKDDKRNASGKVQGDVFEASLVAINEILTIAQKEGAYGYTIYTTSDKVVNHITSPGNHGADLDVLSEIREKLTKLVQSKVDVRFEVVQDAGHRSTMADAEKLASSA